MASHRCFSVRLLPTLVVACLFFSPATLAEASQDVDPVLAVVNGVTITSEDFRAEMQRRAGHVPGQYETVEQRRALLDEMIEFEALAARATAEGLDRDPDLVAVFRKLLVNRYRTNQLDARLAAIEVSDEDVRRFYDQHKDEYARPARRQAALVYFKLAPGASEERRAEVERRAAAALEEARGLDPNIRHFGEVARANSDDRSSRYKGGVIGWIADDSSQQFRWGDEVVQTIRSLERPGDLGPVVRTDSGLYLVRLVDREEAEARPFEALEDGFRYQLIRREQQRVREEFLQEVLSGLPVEVDEALLEAIEPPTPGPAEAPEKKPPPLPAG